MRSLALAQSTLKSILNQRGKMRGSVQESSDLTTTKITTTRSSVMDKMLS